MLANLLKMKLMNKNLERKWRELKKMAERRWVDKELVHKSMENSTKNLTLNLKSFKRAIKLKAKFVSFFNIRSYSKT